MPSLILISIAICGLPQDGKPNVDNAFIVKCIENNAGKINSGAFKLLHSLKCKSQSGVIQLAKQAEGYYAFDYAAGNYRFDYYEGWIGKQPEKNKPLLVEGKKYIRTSDYILCTPIGSTMGPEAKCESIDYFPVNHSISRDIKLFDFRNMGFCFPYSIESNRAFDVEMQVLNLPPQAIDEPSNGVIERTRVSYDVNKEYKHTNKIWFDKKYGYQGVKSSLVSTKVSTGEEYTDHVTETSWQQINSIWVPVSYRTVWTAKNPGPGQPKDEINEYTLIWEGVNQRLDPKIFTEEGLGIREGTYHLVDHRLGRPILLKEKGKKPGEPMQKMFLSSDFDFHWTWWKIALLILAGIMFIAAVWATYRVLRRRYTT